MKIGATKILSQDSQPSISKIGAIRNSFHKHPRGLINSTYLTFLYILKHMKYFAQVKHMALIEDSFRTH